MKIYFCLDNYTHRYIPHIDYKLYNYIYMIHDIIFIMYSIYIYIHYIFMSQISHHAIAPPGYTHFTSPIRRYADVLMHRLLAAALGIATLPEQLQSKAMAGRGR